MGPRAGAANTRSFGYVRRSEKSWQPYRALHDFGCADNFMVHRSLLLIQRNFVQRMRRSLYASLSTRSFAPPRTVLHVGHAATPTDDLRCIPCCTCIQAPHFPQLPLKAMPLTLRGDIQAETSDGWMDLPRSVSKLLRLGPLDRRIMKPFASMPKEAATGLPCSCS